MVTEVPVLLIGRGGSRGLPGKNVMPILGRPLMSYPILAARHSRNVGKIYLSTDDDAIREVGASFDTISIVRPPKLAADDAMVHDVVLHGYEEIVEREGPTEIFVLLFCNTATITPGIIDEGIEALWQDEELDSAVTVSRYNEYSPVRAKRIDESGLLLPFLDVDSIPGASPDRDSQGDCYFCDCSAWILRASCMDLEKGVLPFLWMGRRTLPLMQSGGLDIDYDYGVAQTEHWLKKNGFTEESTPYESGGA